MDVYDPAMWVEKLRIVIPFNALMTENTLLSDSNQLKNWK
jgi:hypothetical protein